MRAAKITITYNGSHMDIEMKNCSVLDRVLGSAMLIRSIAKKLGITLNEAFEIAKISLEAEEEKDSRKAFAVMALINDLENKVDECSAES